MDRETIRLIHEALHDNDPVVLDYGKVYTPKKHSNGCRYIDYKNVRFIQQNPNKKDSIFAEKAKNGERITWGIRTGNWIFINDEEIRL